MAQKPTYRDLPIQRDNTFVRAVADNALVFPLGRDLELGFVAYSPVPKTNRDAIAADGTESDVAGIMVESAMFEVARVRMSPESAMTMAIQIFAREIEAGRIKDTDVTEALQRFREASVPGVDN